jgi:hypothetical protein
MRHFIATTSLSAEELVDVFIARIYSLHGTPDNIVSDRGTQFVSEFWRHLSERLNIQLKRSSSFHPETDGQTERMNAGVEQYLRAFMTFHQNDWVDWLPLAEFSANNVVSETTGTSPFFANYGFHPRMGVEPSQPRTPEMTPAQKREFFKANEVADRFERILTQLKALAAQSIQRYEDNANRRRHEAPMYKVGDRVWVSTENMKTNRPMKKGDDKWDGPFTVEKVYKRSCLVKIPSRMRIFPVFHNSLIRPMNEEAGLPGQDKINEHEAKANQGKIYERDDSTQEIVEKWEFETIEDSHDQAGLQYLIKWKHHRATWQPADDLRGQDEAILDFHRRNPGKPGPPDWVRGREAATATPAGTGQEEQPRRTRRRPRNNMAVRGRTAVLRGGTVTAPSPPWGSHVTSGPCASHYLFSSCRL